MNDDTMEDICDRLARLERSRPPIDGHVDDQRWDCERCGQLAGLIDSTTHRVRVQVREFNVDFVPAEGEPVRIKCKRCGWLNARSWPQAG